MKKKVGIQIITEITIEIDTNDPIVDEYETEAELLQDLISYEFSNVLPVVEKGGVVVLEKEVMDWSSIDKE
jgi:hypothetical protein